MSVLLNHPQTIVSSVANQKGAQILARVLEGVELTPEADAMRLAFLSVLHDMDKKGRAFTVMSLEEELTPNQAAELIGVSRPFLMHLLQHKLIAYRQVGTHYRIRLSELTRYQQEQERRHAFVDELVRDGEEIRAEMGL
jgi:excisionase family DNA binding protein